MNRKKGEYTEIGVLGKNMNTLSMRLVGDHR